MTAILHLVRRPVEPSLEPFFRGLMLTDAESAWERWTAWRSAFPAAGPAYCAATRSDVSVPMRLRDLDALSAQLPVLADHPGHRTELLYCLVTNAVADHPAATTPAAAAGAATRAQELLSALLAEPVRP